MIAKYFPVVLVVLALNSGCLINHSHRTILRQTEPLYPVAFESAESKQIYEEFVEGWIEQEEEKSKSSLAIPFLIGTEHCKVTAENAVRNDVAARFDANGDGLISLQEARVFR